MSLESVINEIISQANKNKAAAIAETKKQADSILDEARRKQQELDRKNNEELSRKKTDYRNKEFSSLELQMKKQQLNVRKEIMQGIEEAAKKEISSLANDPKLITALLKNAMKELPDAKYFYCNRSDKALVQKIAPHLRFATTIDCLGGVVLENADHSIRANHTFEVILENVLEENMHETYKRVFG